MNIATILEARARERGDRPAIVERGRTLSFGGLDLAAAAIAGQLAAAGVTAGTRVLVLVPMSIALYTVVIALFRVRATAVFVDPSGTRERLDACVRRVRPAAFVGIPSAHWLRLTSAAVRAIPVRMTIGGWAGGAARLHEGGAPRPVEPCDPSTPAIMTFTSGSTGEPKAAVRTHGFLVAQHRVLAESLAPAPGETDLSTLPIFVLANLASGVTSVIPDADLREPAAIDAGAVVRQIDALRPIRTVASPAFLGRLVEHASRENRTLDSFRSIYTGGAPVFPRDLDAIARAAPAARVVAVYGSTEAEPIAELDRRDISDDDRVAMTRGAGLLAGRPVASVTVRILRDRWGTPIGVLSQEALAVDTLGAGEVGEIVVTGDHVLRGYLDARGDEETKIRVGDGVWHRTGDAGYVDATGRLWLLGRASAKVSDGDGVVYPFAVECAARDVPGLVRTAFVQHRGRRMVVAEAPGTRETIRGDLLRRLEWAHVADVLFVDRIPVDRRHNAKTDYPALQRLLNRL